jgi:hypothetical protein
VRGRIEQHPAVTGRLSRLPGIRTLRSARFRLVVAVVLLVDTLVGFALNAYLALDGWRSHGDIRQNLLAGRELLRGQGIYGPLPAAPADRVLVDQFHILYPPSHFIMVLPWLVMPDPWWRLSWLLLNIAAVAVLLWVLLSSVPGGTATERILAVALVLSFDPLRIGIEQGQTQLLVTCLVALAALGLQRNRQVAGGIALGLAVALKITILPVAVFFVWRRGHRLLAAAAASFGAVLLATIGAGWLPRWFEWVNLMGPINRGSAMVVNQAVNGFWLRILAPGLSGQPISSPGVPVQALVLVTNLVIVAGVAWLVVHVRVPEPERLWIQLSLVLIALPMVQAYGLDHHYTAAVLAVPAILRLAARRLLPLPAILGVAAGWLMVLLSDPIIYSLAHRLPSSGWVHQPVPLAASSMLLYAMLVILVSLGLGALSTPKVVAPEPS